MYMHTSELQLLYIAYIYNIICITCVRMFVCLLDAMNLIKVVDKQR